MDKIRAILMTGSGRTLVALFLYGGLTALQTHFTGNAQADITLALSVIGMLAHPTDMTGGHSIPR